MGVAEGASRTNIFKRCDMLHQYFDWTNTDLGFNFGARFHTSDAWKMWHQYESRCYAPEFISDSTEWPVGPNMGSIAQCSWSLLIFLLSIAQLLEWSPSLGTGIISTKLCVRNGLGILINPWTESQIIKIGYMWLWTVLCDGFVLKWALGLTDCNGNQNVWI